MKISFFSIVIIFLFSTLTMSGQTVKWLMQPDYDSICYYSKDIFKCSKDNKIQLIDLSGKPLLAMDADSVTDFAEGFALVLNKKGADFQLKGYLDEEHHDFIAVNGNFHTTYYSHFSEGLLAVADEKGRQGYLDTRGHVSIPCNLKKARPFVQGWACVESMKEGTVFIDKEGSYMIVQFHLGKLSIATNFNEKGEALVGYTENGQNDFAVINTSGKTIRNYTNRKGKPYRDYDFAFKEGVPDITPERNETPIFNPNISVFSSNGLFGYKNHSQDVIVLPQFSHAGRFTDNCAIVAHNGRYGVITLVEGNISSTIEDSDISIKGNKTTEFNYTLNVPETIDPNHLQVRFDNGDGELRPVQLSQSIYDFIPYIDKNANTCTIRAEVEMDGLKLWEESITKKINRIPTSTIEFNAPYKATEYAGADNSLRVKTIVTNKTDEPVKVSVSFALTFQSGSKNSLSSDLSPKDATLSPGEKKEFSITFKVNERESVKTSVTVKAGQQSIGTKTSNIVLKPFDLIE